MMLHADQFFHMAGFSNDEPAAKHALTEMFARDGVHLDALSDAEWQDALPAIEAQGSAAFRKVCTGDFFHHPRCAKCERCRRHRPECFYDQQNDRQKLTCNRCAEAMRKS